MTATEPEATLRNVGKKRGEIEGGRGTFVFESSQMREGVHATEYKIAKMGLVSWLVMDEIEDPGIVLLDDLEHPFPSVVTVNLERKPGRADRAMVAKPVFDFLKGKAQCLGEWAV